MNVMLIHPYIKVREVETYLSEPLGLLCLASYLDTIFKNTVTVSILDLYALGAMSPEKQGEFFCLGINDPDFISDELKKSKPDLIGITCNFTAYAQDSLEVANIVKTITPGVPIIIGGAHPTIEAFSILQNCKSIDYVAKGKGEMILEDLIRALRGEMKIEDVDGLVFRKGGEIIVNNLRSLIKDLDVLPLPGRHYIDIEKYNYFNKETVWYARKKPVATIMTSRGCPYDCVFCSTKVVWTRRWRFRGLENVFKEIRMLVEDYGIKEIVINDDQFLTRKKRIHESCDYFIENKMDVCFSVDSGISIWLADKELLVKMKKAGFYSLRFPIESGCKKTLEYIKKPVDLDQAKILIEEANKLGFWTSSNIIIGFPHETKEQVMKSINYAYDSTLDFTSFIIAKPNAGSDMYEDFRREGLLEKVVVRGSDFYRSDYDTIYLTAKELNDIANEAASRWFIHKLLFYIKPRNFYNYLLPKAGSFNDFLYLMGTLKNSVFQRALWIVGETLIRSC